MPCPLRTRLYGYAVLAVDEASGSFPPIADIHQLLHHAFMTDGELSVQLLDANGGPVPIADVHLDVRFYVDGRFRYSFSLGRTDAHGACRTNREEIERQLEANRRFFIMDYNTPLMDCDPVVGIAAPTAGELAEREAFRAKWWPEEPTMYGGAANDRMRCPEQKFELQWGTHNSLNLVGEVAAGA